MGSDPERNWNPSRCAPPARGSCALILSHSRSASINKALRHRGDQVPEFKQAEQNLGFSSSSPSLRHFSSSAFVSVSTRFLVFLISIYPPSESARTTYLEGSALAVCQTSPVWVLRPLCPPTAESIPSCLRSLSFCCVHRCTDVIPGKLPLSLVLQPVLLSSFACCELAIEDWQACFSSTVFPFCIFGTTPVSCMVGYNNAYTERELTA